MPKLKGLLDSANAKLAGLLGDFPQGFNAGAVAGFPGWAGDMAYLADTARLALTGADSQAAPEDYVGTTDYIAKQAGYPVPQTLSGQLGAAVGGLMSPGPGDLAKFAPVLSAIPFWHGSPHKYDAVDLSKIGTGEGAQAYGYGYYGAEAQSTASEYRKNLSEYHSKGGAIKGGGESVELPGWVIAKIQSDGIDPAMSEWAARIDEMKASLPGHIQPWIVEGNIQRMADELGAMGRIKAAQDMQIDAPGNLYRGEYRWPDPAKEAATPLTGEDLLDWDKPLSEQPAIRDVLRLEIEDDSTRFDPKFVVTSYASTQDGGKVRWPIAKPFSSREAAEAATANLTGAQIYQYLSRNSAGANSEVAAESSRSLKSIGIPGIRYLDQMSRGAGEGTRNYVMFDDKGIKLLERNGEPIKAAEDFAARRAGKAKPYREATGQRTLQDVVSELEQRGITVDAAQSGNNPDLVTLSRIVVPQEQRGQGVGTQAMQDLIGYADEQGKTIALSPSADFGASSVDRLKDFYKRFGFVDNKGKGRDFEISESMYRRGAK